MKKTEQNKNLTKRERKEARELEVLRWVEKDSTVRNLNRKIQDTQKKNRVLQERLETRDRNFGAVLKLRDNIKITPIESRYSDSTGEATIVALASDWHIDEKVSPEKVNYKNRNNLEVATQRAHEFFVNILKLHKLHSQGIRIDNLILALLGDFISGNIHPELLANCLLPPIKAQLFAQNIIISGIQYLLDNSKLHIYIPCHVGNHPRITQKVYVSEEQGNSLEYFMYKVIANHFRNESRLEFHVSESYFSFKDVYGKKLAFHHGHFVKYMGGVGGLFVPMLRSIGQWNLGADIYFNGHHHQMLDGGIFVSNGSNIGYGALSLMFRGAYAPSAQQFVLIDKKRGKTVVQPILYSV